MKHTLQLLVLFFFLFTSVQKSYSQSSIPQAQSIFTYNFTRLIEWPADYKTGDFIIEVYGSGDFYSEIKNYTSGKTVGAQPIVVKKLTNIDEIGKCNILFINFGKSKEIPIIVEKIGSGKTLIIAEKKGCLEDGAAINFVIIEDKLKYELKSSNMTKVGLKFNSNLENMAYAKH